MKGRGCGDNDAGSGDEEGDKKSDREVGDGKSAMFGSPLLFKESIGKKEGHVDANGGSKGRKEDVFLFLKEGGSPTTRGWMRPQ